MKSNPTRPTGSSACERQIRLLPDEWRDGACASLPHTSTCEATSKHTSSPASADGATRCASPASETISPSGQEAARANHFLPPDEEKDSMTTGTSGPPGSISSASAALQSSLESRLRARMRSGGSTLFSLTWKERATPAQRRICQLRASVLRTSGKGSTGSPSADLSAAAPAEALRRPGGSPEPVQMASWPSPVTNDAKGVAYTYANGNHDRPSLRLLGAARLSSWATPASHEAGGTPASHEAGGTPEQFLARKVKARANGSELGISLTSLSLQAQMCQWTTETGETSEPDGSKEGRPLPRGGELRVIRPLHVTNNLPIELHHPMSHRSVDSFRDRDAARNEIGDVSPGASVVRPVEPALRPNVLESSFEIAAPESPSVFLSE